MNVNWATIAALLALATIGIVAFVLIWRGRNRNANYRGEGE